MCSMGRRASAHELFVKMRIRFGIGIAAEFTIETLTGYLLSSLIQVHNIFKTSWRTQQPDPFGIQVSTSLIPTAFRTGSPNN